MLNLENPYAPLVWNRDFLAKHRVVFNTMWELPFGPRKRYANSAPAAVNQIIGGWSIAWVTYLQTGQFSGEDGPGPVFSGSDPSNTNTDGGVPDRICDGNLPAGQRTIDHWFDTSCFVAPPEGAGRFGNSGVNVIEGPGLHTHNVTIVKNFKFTERVNLDVMTLIGNIFNHPNFLFPAADISTDDAGVIGGTHNLYSGERAGQRMIEFRARIRF